MRQQSPNSKFMTQHVRLVGSPPSSVRDSRSDSVNSRVTKVTTYRHPKSTITTTTFRPVVETRTVHLCSHENKCQGHEIHIEQLTQENIKLNQRILELSTEMESVSQMQKSDYSQWQNSQIDGMRRHYNDQQSNYEQEIKYLNTEVTQYRSQIKLLDEQCKYLSSQITKQQQQESWENQIALLSTEVERLSTLVIDKNCTLDLSAARCKELETQLRVRDEVLDERNSELAKYKRQSSEALQQIIVIKSELERLTETNQQLVLTLNQSKTEKNTQYNFIIEQKDTQISQLKGSIQLLEMRMQELEISLVGYQKEIDNLEIRLDTMTQQVEYFQGECADLTNHKIELGDALEGTQQDNSRLQDQLYQMKLEINNLNTKYEQLKLEQTQSMELQAGLQIDQLEQANKEYEELRISTTLEYQELFKKYNDETQQLRNELEDLEMNNKTINALKQQISRQCDDKISEIQTIKSQYQILNSEYNTCKQRQSEEIHQLKIQIEDYLIQISKLNSKKQQLENNVADNQEQVMQLEMQLQLVTNEMNSLRLKSIEEVHSFRSQMEDYEVSNTQLANQKSKYQRELEEKTQQIKQLQDQLQQLKQTSNLTISELEKKIYQYEEKLSLLSSEIQRMLFNINQKNDLIQEQANALNEYADKLTNIDKEMTNNILQFQDREILLTMQCQSLDSKYQDKQYKLDAEILQLKTLNGEITHKLSGLTKQLEQQQNELKYRQCVEEEMTQKNQYLANQLANQSAQNSEYKFHVEQLSIQFKALENEIQQRCESESELKYKLDKLIEELKIKQIQIIQLEDQLNDNQSNQQQEIITYEEQVTHYKKEVDTWKDKFILLNRDYHKTQEELMMTQAEFDAFKQRKNMSEYKQVKDSSCFEVRKSSLYVQKENMDSRQSVTSVTRVLRESNI